MWKSTVWLWIVCAGVWASACTQVERTGRAPAAMLPAGFDWQGHRGARGLAPENTAPAMLRALELGVTTLELDVVVTADSQLVLSHEPWMSPEICSLPVEWKAVDTLVPGPAIYRMTLAQVQALDCGQKGHPRFPEQVRQAVYKPKLRWLMRYADSMARKLNRPLPFYNIETKITPEWEAKGLTPTPERFAALLAGIVSDSAFAGRVYVQSFDVRTLQVLHRAHPRIPLVLLVENNGSLRANLDSLGFVPAVYSPYHELLSSQLIADCHRQGMRVVPWTVNEPARMQELVRMGVDGLISDYPNRYWEVVKSRH